MAQNGDPGRPAHFRGDTAVWGHFPHTGPLFGPQMARYVSGPQRGQCAADLGLVLGAKKIGGALPQGAGGGSEGALRAYSGCFCKFLPARSLPIDQTCMVDRSMCQLLGAGISGLNSSGKKYNGRSKPNWPNWTESATAHSGMDFFPKFQNRHEISYVNYLWRPYLQV